MAHFRISLLTKKLSPNSSWNFAAPCLWWEAKVTIRSPTLIEDHRNSPILVPIPTRKFLFPVLQLKRSSGRLTVKEFEKERVRRVWNTFRENESLRHTCLQGWIVRHVFNAAVPEPTRRFLSQRQFLQKPAVELKVCLTALPLVSDVVFARIFIPGMFWSVFTQNLNVPAGKSGECC